MPNKILLSLEGKFVYFELHQISRPTLTSGFDEIENLFCYIFGIHFPKFMKFSDVELDLVRFFPLSPSDHYTMRQSYHLARKENGALVWGIMKCLELNELSRSRGK